MASPPPTPNVVGIPNWNSPFVDTKSGLLTFQWQQFLLQLWQHSDLSQGQPGEGQPVGTTPGQFVFSAPIAGAVAVSGADLVEVSRDQGTSWIIVGATNAPGSPVVAQTVTGLYPLRFADQIRVTWSIVPAPIVTWLPD